MSCGLALERGLHEHLESSWLGLLPERGQRIQVMSMPALICVQAPACPLLQDVHLSEAQTVQGSQLHESDHRGFHLIPGPGCGISCCGCTAELIHR